MAAEGKIISRNALKKFVGGIIKPYWRPIKGNYAGFFDHQYYVPTLSEAKSLLQRISYPDYVLDEFDCEDFSYMCKAESSRLVRNSPIYNHSWAIGLAWARFRWIKQGKEDHTCNWFVTSDRQFYWFEPQPELSKPYSANNCIPHSLELLLG